MKGYYDLSLVPDHGMSKQSFKLYWQARGYYFPWYRPNVGRKLPSNPKPSLRSRLYTLLKKKFKKDEVQPESVSDVELEERL